MYASICVCESCVYGVCVRESVCVWYTAVLVMQVIDLCVRVTSVLQCVAMSCS